MLGTTYEELLSQHINGRFLHLILVDNTSNPPTQAQLTAVLGKAEDSPGQIIILDDNGANTNTYLIASNGQSWYQIALTKAA